MSHGPMSASDAAFEKDSLTFGMWVFLVTEFLFFGVLFAGYTLYRIRFPEAFAEGSYRMDISLGCINTLALITSSLTMALAVHRAHIGGNRKALAGWLFATLVLGCVFLGIKAVEYHHKFVEHLFPGPHFRFDGPPALVDQAQIFFSIYFMMTGLHAVHMIIGIGVVAWLIFMALRGKYEQGDGGVVECVGLYWHFVDIVWIFLFPLLYLIGRHG